VARTAVSLATIPWSWTRITWSVSRPASSCQRLDADAYLIELRDEGIVYYSKRLVRNNLPWRYVGCCMNTSSALMPGPKGYWTACIRFACTMVRDPAIR